MGQQRVRRAEIESGSRLKPQDSAIVEPGATSTAMLRLLRLWKLQAPWPVPNCNSTTGNKCSL